MWPFHRRASQSSQSGRGLRRDGKPNFLPARRPEHTPDRSSTFGAMGAEAASVSSSSSPPGATVASHPKSARHGQSLASPSSSSAAAVSRSAVPPAEYPSGQRERLRATAQETLEVLPDVLGTLGTLDAARDAKLMTADSRPRLHPGDCPAFARPATIRVVNDDTLNVAIRLAACKPDGRPRPLPLIVNFANRHRPGGGWCNGAMAQEEALCYRSSLSLSLHEQLYPLSHDAVLYSRYVLVVREDLSSGHGLLVPAVSAVLLPVVSAVTVAALYQPEVRTLAARPQPGRRREDDHDERRSGHNARKRRQHNGHAEAEDAHGDGREGGRRHDRRERERNDSNGRASSQESRGSRGSRRSREDRESQARESQASCRTLAGGRRSTLPPSPSTPTAPPHTMLVFARDRDRDTTKAKMRLTLRAAASHGHDQLVLGALGCGVFGNPAEDVAHCWLEVLREHEFAGAGHWWRDVVFAVYAGSGNSRDCSNYSIFRRVLNGQQV